MWESKTWLLHHDNAPAHTALSIRKFLAGKDIRVLKQPFYSPDLADLAPCDLFLFPKVKNTIKATHFSSTVAIKNAVTKELRGIPEESFQKSIDAWKKIEKCIKLKRDYFEGDNI